VSCAIASRPARRNEQAQQIATFVDETFKQLSASAVSRRLAGGDDRVEPAPADPWSEAPNRKSPGHFATSRNARVPPVPAALYYPYSRWLDDVALKRAVLIHDKLVFIDPVDEATRADLYLREGRVHAAGRDPSGMEQSITLGRIEPTVGQIVETIPRPHLKPELLDALVDHGLRIDLEINELKPLFARRPSWQMLADRLPPSAFK
jgi:hypothetical protein